MIVGCQLLVFSTAFAQTRAPAPLQTLRFRLHLRSPRNRCYTVLPAERRKRVGQILRYEEWPAESIG